MFLNESAPLPRPRVKICGITTAADALAAAEYGADAIGVNFYTGSKRYISPAQAMEWLGELPSELAKVAVLVNPSYDEAVAIAALPHIDALQLHGRETPELCARLAAARVAFGKAVPVTSEESLDCVEYFSTSTLVLDSARGGTFGGSGSSFPWHVARRFIEREPTLRIILAGGLTPENVAAAAREVRPFGVDVTTGVEAEPGRKDLGRMRAFIESAHAAFSG